MIKSFVNQIRSKAIPYSCKSANRGFTLAEVMVAMAVMSVVMVMVISVTTSLSRSNATQNVAAGVQQVTRAGIDIMTRNIRKAGLNPLNINPIGIVQATSNSIRFQYDTNGSGTIATNAIDDANEDMGYLLNGNKQLIRQLNGKANTNRSMIDNVSDLTFRYLDADNAQTSDLSAIRTIKISLTVEEPAGREQSLSRTYSTRVICRNLRLE